MYDININKVLNEKQNLGQKGFFSKCKILQILCVAVNFVHKSSGYLKYNVMLCCNSFS